MIDYSQIYKETYGSSPTESQLQIFIEYLLLINAIQSEK